MSNFPTTVLNTLFPLRNKLLKKAVARLQRLFAHYQPLYSNCCIPLQSVFQWCFPSTCSYSYQLKNSQTKFQVFISFFYYFFPPKVYLQGKTSWKVLIRVLFLVFLPCLCSWREPTFTLSVQSSELIYWPLTSQPALRLLESVFAFSCCKI